MLSKTNKMKITTMRITLFISIILMVIKFIAYGITDSNAILTDALESIINVVAGVFALYSIYYASKPKDKDHPYGHGKMESLSAGFEGGLILIAGLSIMGKATYDFFHPHPLNDVDLGTIITAVAGIVNMGMGMYLIKKGEKHNSVLMVADGKHLLTDTVSSAGLVVGLIIIYFTKIYWIDNLLALIFGAVILLMGYKLVKESVTNLLDEADYKKLNHLITILNKNRIPNWIDMHNLRILKYGGELHIDCHITLPYYDTLEATHKQVDAVETLLQQHTEGEVEFFIHSEPCDFESCPICSIADCPVRKTACVKTHEWTMENLLPDEKHHL